MNFQPARCKKLLCALLWVLLLTTAGAAQSQAPAEKPNQSHRPPSSSHGPQNTDESAEQNKISPKEAEELFHSVDEILQFASQDTALPIHKEVKRRLTSRDEVTAYLEKHMAEDEDAKRLQRSESVLKKFGLLPRDFDLGKFLVALLREQVAGYYDPKTRTVNLLDWLDAEQQRPVLAHELTHALQDQSFGLEKWMKAGTRDLALEKKDPTSSEIDQDEVETARQAVVEGQAMAVLIDYMLAPTGQSLTSSPQIVEAMKQGMLVGTADSVQFRNAPIFMKEILTFPYRYGLDFVGEVLVKNGKDKAYAGVFENPPRSTRQIMEPKTYLSGERIEPMPVPEFSRLTTGYDKYDVGSMGEFDVALLVDQYEGVDASRDIYPQWRGGYYYAARPKGSPSGPLALLYVSRWASTESASHFAAIYANSLKKRYRSLRELELPARDQKPTAEPQPNQQHAAAPTAANAVLSQQSSTTAAAPVPAASDAALREWLTEEGDVIIDTVADTVFITESFDDQTSGKLRESILPNPATTSH